MEQLFEACRLRGWERALVRLADGLTGVGCLSLVAIPILWNFTRIKESALVLFLPCLVATVILCQALASWRIRKPFRRLQHRLGQCYLGDYVRGQDEPRCLALRGRALPHGEQVFVWAGLTDDGGRLHSCRGPALQWDRLAEAAEFTVVERDLTVEEARDLSALLEERLESVPSAVRDGFPCEVAVNDGTRPVYRAGVNLSSAQEDQPVARLARRLLELGAFQGVETPGVAFPDETPGPHGSVGVAGEAHGDGGAVT